MKLRIVDDPLSEVLPSGNGKPEELITYYDRSIRLWVAYYLDSTGFQSTPAGYGPTKDLAVADISVQEPY